MTTTAGNDVIYFRVQFLPFSQFARSIYPFPVECHIYPRMVSVNDGPYFSCKKAQV